jgi:hypothetical protein
MRLTKTRTVAAVAVIGALAAGGAAYTADVGGVPETSVAGFHQTAISGGQVNSLKWNYSEDGQYILSATMNVTTDGTAALPSGSVVSAGFDDSSNKGNANLVTCDNGGSGNDYTCAFPGSGVSAQGTSVFNVSITDSANQTGVGTTGS